MHPRVVSAWVDDIRSNSPLPPEDQEVVWPLPRLVPNWYLRQLRELERQQQQSHPFAAAELHPDQKVKMPPRRSPRKRSAEDSQGRSLQLDDVRVAISEINHSGLPANNESENVSGPTDHSCDEVDDEDPDMTPRPPRHSTVETSRSTSIFSRRLPQLTSSTSLPPSQAHSPTRQSRSTTISNRTRSKSPIKRAYDLTKLEKPVRWCKLPKHKDKLERNLQNCQSATLFDPIMKVLKGGYLPMELRGILDVELGLDGTNKKLYAKRPPGPNTKSQLLEAEMLLGAACSKIDKSVLDFLHLNSLLSELEALRSIVAATQDHLETPRTEASWNEKVHRPMLDLAILHIPAVGIENITRATIAKGFLPQTSVCLGPLSPDSKLIDYAMVLKPEEPVEALQPGQLDHDRIAKFLGQLEDQCFNQSHYGPLTAMPSGVFVETKAEDRKTDEAKTQLGMWLASWYGRIAQFPCLSDEEDALPSPVIPVLIIEKEVWNLWFAFDTASQYEVYGPIKIGSTDELDGAYRVLAVLRIIAQWMATDFLDWVEKCLDRAGV
ncbi:hypothetical protein F5Y01DRAFT_318872 [Xylaria sp. FL0043]|nr:hypothetical protein F5Y01DRAFT_318872 [Xylaria sp. FL0043]